MSAEWQKLANVWYRKRDIYEMPWCDEPDRLRLSVVAGAPYGGPIATVRDDSVFQEVRGSLKPELQIFTSAGRLISSTLWAHSGLVAMSWSSSELLVCVFKDGVIRTFSVFCEMIHFFTVDEQVKLEGVLQVSFWPDGVVLLTQANKVVVNNSLERRASTRYADLGLPNHPLCICVLPPLGDTPGGDVQLLVASKKGEVYKVEKDRCTDVGLDQGPYQAFALSPSGALLACLSTNGLFKVLAVADLLQGGCTLLDEANIECRKAPKQMVWCGNDCIALYLQIATPSASVQHVLFVGGPQNDWIPYQYDNPVYLVSECDGCRIVGTQKCEFLQRVPQSTEAIYSIGSCEPPAMLCYALERFEVGDVRAEESLRAIKEELSDAISACIDAATYEPDCATAQSLLNAAVFGRHFLNERSASYSKAFIETCQNLRICLALRGQPLEIPVTCTQLQAVTVPGMLMRMANRRAHLLAVRISDWVGVPKDRVLIHWASEKIKHSLSLTDNQLCDEIKAKFEYSDGISFAEVAGVAAKAFRPNLAIILLNYEPRGRDQVHLLLKLGEIFIAFEKAASNGDPDLLHECLGTILSQDSEGVSRLLMMIKEKPQEMQLARNIFISSLRMSSRDLENYERLQQVFERLGNHFSVAQTCILQAFCKSAVEQRITQLKYAAQWFGHTDSETKDSDKASMQFGAAASTEEAQLLKLQEQYQMDAMMKNWEGRDRKFLGLSVADTIKKLIMMNQVAEADRMKEHLKIGEKRYWRIKVKGLAEAGLIDELYTMATQRTPPVGYEVVVEAFLSAERNDMAAQFVPRVKSFELQAKFYTRMRMETEAQQALSRKDERSGAGGFLGFFSGL